MVGVPANHHRNPYIHSPNTYSMYFFTATINSWKPLLQDNEMKDIIVNSLRWLDKEKRAFTHGFVIMPNHVHILWSYGELGIDPSQSFLSYTGHEFKKKLKAFSPHLLGSYLSTQNDRDYHFWERRSRIIETKSRDIVIQKLDYIHDNPLQEKWKLADVPEAYQYSSARFYMQIDCEFEFLKHYVDFS
jgi:REP element-mobilizing transposase RayT